MPDRDIPDMNHRANYFTTCGRCGTPLQRRLSYQFGRGQAATVRCLRCAAVYPPIIRRAAVVSLIVGTCLTLINQGDAIGQLQPVLVWKIPLTYVVPFLVSLYSGLAAARIDMPAGPPTGGIGEEVA